MRLPSRFASVRSFLLAAALCGVASAVHAAVPAPWGAQDVGAPSPAGTSSLNSSTFTITASGADIWGNSDQFHFVYQQVSGDVEVIARVDSLAYTNVWAKAGVMLRSSLSASAAEAFVGVTPNPGVIFQHRPASGQYSINDGFVSGSGAPRWVRLVRSGDTVTAYHGTDGAQWTRVNAITVPLGSSIYVGLAVTSHASGIVTTATLSNALIKGGGGGTPPPPPSGGTVPAPQKASDIGGPAIAGSTTFASGVYTINAGGTDIWGTSDQFHYVYQPLSGDGEIIARVSGLGAADPWTKAGVMVRESLAANSRHAFATMTAANGYAFQRRIDTGGFSTTTSGGAGVAPGWVRLVRTGYKFDAYRSTDGQAWTLIGSETVPMTDPVYVGIAVTSHNASLGTTAKVDNLTIKSGSTPGNQLPTVTLTAPAAGASFTAPATITLAANASDPENRLSHVAFYAGSTLLSTDTTAPYSFSWASVPAGTYSVKAVASDADGGTATSAPVTVTVQGTAANQPPTVTLTSPSAGATAPAPATVTISATASDPEGRMARVEFYSGTTLLNSDTTAPYSYSWSGVPAGTYSLTAKAYDADGGTASSTAVALTVTAPSSSAPISFVQSAYAVPQTPQTSVAVRYPNAQTAGDLNVVVIGWNDAVSHVASVRDTVGNVYTPAAAPTVQPGVQTIAIYYAANIAAAGAGANTVTVTFDNPADFADVRIAEYRGIATASPVDAAIGASGTGGSSSSGTLTTRNANDLLVAANNVQSGSIGAGTGFTSRVITTPDGNILEDRVVTATGSYTATAPLGGSMGWVMQMVAFRGAGGGAPAPGDTQAPTAPTGLTATAASGTAVNLSWTASTDNTAVTSYLIERCQGSGCTSFTQVGTSSATTYSVSGLSASTTYGFRARAMDAAGNMSGYSNVATATTPATSDTQAPTAPTAVTATATSSTQINLTWTAATDNVGVTGYVVERCQAAGCANFAQVGTPTGTSYSDTSGLTASTSYSYRIRARDAAGNLGAYSTVTSATTQAGSAPAPKQVAFAASPDHSTTLLTGYRLEIFAASANPSTATPIATSDLGKPTPAANGDITVDRTTFFSGLATGTYQATVSAYGPGGTSRSTPVTFTR